MKTCEDRVWRPENKRNKKREPKHSGTLGRVPPYAEEDQLPRFRGNTGGKNISKKKKLVGGERGEAKNLKTCANCGSNVGLTGGKTRGVLF